MEKVTRVQNLDEAAFIFRSANTLSKDMNSTFQRPAMGNICLLGLDKFLVLI